MRKGRNIFFAIFLTILLSSFAQAEAQEHQEIHCKHFFYGYPTGTPATNDLIIRDIYALSSNDTTKFADWVAYRLDHDIVVGDAETQRRWKADPWLEDSETLEPGDYDGAHAALKTDRGHQAPLASFKGTGSWAETNYLSNITPQKSDLNQGPWQRLEDKVRSLVEEGYTVYVMTGPLYEKDMQPLPNADETHKVPSGYWKIILVQLSEAQDSIRAASFVFDQETGRRARIIENLTTINKIEQRSGLDFLRELPDDVEEAVEGNKFSEWAEEHFK